MMQTIFHITIKNKMKEETSVINPQYSSKQFIPAISLKKTFYPIDNMISRASISKKCLNCG